MSWTDAVQNKFIITTGDGKSFTLLWKNTCVKEIEYNIAQFDFPKISGSLINRGTPMARKFNLDIYFQGENNLDDGLAFEVSANDPRAWQISHPIHGSILVQPIGLKFDYTGYNIVQVTGTLIETLGSAGLKIVVVPLDKIIADKVALDEVQAQSFNTVQELLSAREITAADLGTGTKQITTLKGINKALYDIGVKAVALTEDAGEYLNLFNSANTAINQVITLPGQAMQAIQAVVNFPGIMVTSIQIRMSVLQAQLDMLRANISPTINRADKKNYESIAGTLISTTTQAAVTSYNSENIAVTDGLLPDYPTRASVLAIITLLQEMFNTYLADLDLLQSDNGGSETSYIPDAESISGMDSLINFTIENLYQIALSAKQERSVILDTDSNLILLAHRFYGLQPDDSTIDTLMKNNKIGLTEILQIKKGRTIIYYV